MTTTRFGVGGSIGFSVLGFNVSIGAYFEREWSTGGPDRIVYRADPSLKARLGVLEERNFDLEQRLYVLDRDFEQMQRRRRYDYDAYQALLGTCRRLMAETRADSGILGVGSWVPQTIAGAADSSGLITSPISPRIGPYRGHTYRNGAFLRR